MDEYEEDFGDDFDDEQWFDPEAEIWFSSLGIWRPSRLSDERMEESFPHQDGRWSGQTKRAMQRFRAAGLDLNENWALSFPFWRCPACDREKPQIFRLSPRRILLAKLEVHHDHLQDVISKRGRELFGPDWMADSPAEVGLVLDRIRDLVCRFSFALVCSECNAADAEVKARHHRDIDSRFTFTPSEIKSFITPRPNAPHDVRHDQAFGIWEAARAGFEERLRLLDDLLHKTKAGVLSHDRTGRLDADLLHRGLDVSAILSAAFFERSRGTPIFGLLIGYRGEFLARSISRDSARLPPPPKTSVQVKRPTDEEFAAYIDPVSSKRWQATPNDWVCPTCRREKRSLLRISKSNKWSGSIRQHPVYIDETDEDAIRFRVRLFPTYTNDRIISRIEMVLLCSDCVELPRQLKHWAPSLGNPVLMPDDIQASIVRATPHERHEIDFPAAMTRATANAPYNEAWEAYDNFRSRASHFASLHQHWLDQGHAADTIFAALAEDLQSRHRIRDATEGRTLAEWLVEWGRGLT